MHDQQKSQFSQRTQWAAGQQIGYLMQQGVDYPDCLSLAAGLVDPATLPVQIVQRQMQEIRHLPKSQTGSHHVTNADMIPMPLDSASPNL
ncbi:MAG: hypothetical protein JKY95_13905 [Planctomycetaceae bacterium]|nr:hypothetical protein [Planctomycetaceae bacterium]